jgi:hypothetical protein
MLRSCLWRCVGNFCPLDSELFDDFGHLLFEITGVCIVDCALVSEYEPHIGVLEYGGLCWVLAVNLSLYFTEDLFRR